jgi:hypothetical protein
VDAVPPQLVSPKHFPLSICPGGIHKVNRSIVMRFISFPILFAVFAILFHSVASVDAPALRLRVGLPPPRAPNTIDPRHLDRAKASLRMSEHSRLQTLVSSGQERENHEELRKLHKQNLLGYLGKQQSPWFHEIQVKKNQLKAEHALQMAERAQSPQEKAKWTATADQHKAWAEMRKRLAHGPQ